MASPDLFDAYFRRADTDRDGRISGQEAVSFFQGANLHREVLAKIWQYADQGQTGFLSRAEFYNALKLVTVAQTGRELTPVIVSRALNGPAASQIPAPQIQFITGPAAVAAQPPRPVRPLGSPTPQSQQYPATSLSPGPRPPIPISLPRTPNSLTPGGPTSIPVDRPTNKSSSWPGPASNNHLTGQNLQAKGASPLQDVSRESSFQAGAVSSAPKIPPSVEPDLFGGDVFTAVPVKPPVVSPQTQSNLAAPQPSPTANQAPLPRAIQTAVGPDPAFGALVPTSFAPAAVSKLQPVAIPAGQQERGFGAPGVDGTKTWPKMTDAIVRRYTKIFFEVDTDKDGKISGTQAHDLFLSWHLPREVLKQIWDLSDQDHDSMLSLREFCVALYLMERHREGRALPAVFPAAFYFDETGVQALRISEAQVAVAQNSAGYNLPAWQQNPSVLQATGPGLPPRPVPHGPLLHGQAPVRAPMPAPGREGFVSGPPVQNKSKAPVLEMNLINQLPADDQLTLQTKHQEAVDAEKKMHELEKQIMDSKEKMEFYRSKMQDIVLFKTRCDNRLAEITERAAADKREVESLAKNYDGKFKQAGVSQSRLLADEAVFRDVQERRLELYNAILRMEQGGDTNALLQARGDRLQNDLDELRKALNTKCKEFGLRIKPTSLLELPYGWQPGIQENAAQWDEDWDKFDDEEFTYVQEFMEDGTAGSDTAKPKTIASWDENGQVEDGFDFSTTDGEVHDEETLSNGNQGMSSPKGDHHDNTARNGDNSPHEDMSSSSPGHPESDIFSTTNTNSKVSQSRSHGPSSMQSESDTFAANGGDWASVFSHSSDDTDSNASWGRNDAPSTKASEESGFQPGKPSTATSFGFRDAFDMLSNPGHIKEVQEDLPSFGPIRTKERSVFFDNSVPSTPVHSNVSLGHISSGGFFDDSVPSTPLYNNVSGGQGPSREQVVRFDSFSSNKNYIGHSPDGFARFDSFNNAAGGPARGFTSFDDSDPFAGTGPFGGGQTARRSTDAWSAFS